MTRRMIRQNERVDRMANRMEMIPCGSTVAFSLTVIVPSSICVSPSGDHILLARAAKRQDKMQKLSRLEFVALFESLRQISEVFRRFQFKQGPLPV